MDERLSGYAPVPFTNGHPNIRTPEEQACVEHPDMPQCQAGIYSYILNARANKGFLLCFVLMVFPLLYIAVTKRRAHFYSIAVFAGLVFEIMGYGARTWSQANQLQNDPFYMQVVCLTVGPAFLAAAIYFCMRSIVFIPCDIVSLILQATGGALAASAHKANDQQKLDIGTKIMIAGLAFQVFTMFVFGCLGFAFLCNVMAELRRARNDSHRVVRRSNRRVLTVGISRSLQFFESCIIGSTLLIFARCCYRVAELSGGWTGSLMKNQTLFIICEGVFILVASLLLVIGHPAICAPEVLDAAAQFGSIREKASSLCCFGGGDGEPKPRSDEEIALDSLARENVTRDTMAGTAQVPPQTALQNAHNRELDDFSVEAFIRESQSSRTVPPSPQPLPKECCTKTQLASD
ncbi:Envelope glycoprotein gp160 [Gnomoniopsis sp. IMI 355080]|nr:Envelope glycoprotein gp160 [Gnomoniopsis sp. IMI 355080]